MTTRELSLESVSTESPLSPEQIDFIHSKYAGMKNTGSRLLREAMELGELFNEAASKYKGQKLGPGNKWRSWLEKTFPEISPSSVSEYRKLANHRELILKAVARDSILGIKSALRYIKENAPQLPSSGAYAIGNQSVLHEGGEPSLESSAIEPPDHEELLSRRLHQYWLLRNELLAEEQAVRDCLKEISLSRKQVLTCFSRANLTDCLSIFGL